MNLDSVVAESRVIVCCGSGGVGKTTTAAVIALHAALLGRKTVVVTIDPARRLADALGLDGLTNDPAQIPDLPAGSGEMWAMMLDTKSTFDELVRRYAADTDQADRILGNSFYRNISGSLSGTQEYMASEKLYELAIESDYDLVVVDTPPTRNALDFLEAPKRLAKFLDHRLYRVLMLPTRGIVKAVNAAAQTLLRSITKVVGAEVIADAIAFFGAFEGMEQGFKERASKVDDLLSVPSTAFILIASPHADTMAEAKFFATRLKQLGMSVRALIINRMQPRFSSGRQDEPDQVEPEILASRLAGTSIGDQYRCLADAQHLAFGERKHVHGLAAQLAPAPVVQVAVQPFEVTNMATLQLLGQALFDPAVTSAW
ncbi:MAG: ArsA family ATPase [Actinomycetes bacterium]